MFTDTIIEKKENHFWKWELTNFTTIYLFFAYKAIGEWHVNQLSKKKILVTYSYSYYSKGLLYHPINWLFVNIQLKGMMKKVIKKIKTLAELKEEDIPII